jgi:hypothetical protein
MRTSREKANVSDGPPVEHSIMKRAWPYALALALVVTGCYLAMAPLLRSLNPGPTGTSAQPLPGVHTTTVPQVNKQPPVQFESNNAGFTSRVKVTVKKAKKATTKKHAKVAQTPIFVSPTTTNTPSSSSSSTTTSSSNTVTTRTPAKPKTNTTKPVSNTARPSGVVSGTIDQADNGGFAGQGNGNSTLPGGKSSTVADGG